MASKFDIKLTPASQRIISNLAKAGKIDLRPTLNVIGTGYRKEVKSIFEKKQPRGEVMKWAPLSERYAAWKNKNFPGKPILVRTGALKASMITKGAEGNITAIGKTQAIFGTSIPYGIYHDSDKKRKKINGRDRLPRRNFSEPSDGRMKIFKDLIEKDIRRNFEINGIKVEGAIFR